VVLEVLGDRARVRTGDDIVSLRPKGVLRHEGLLAGDDVALDGEHIISVAPRRSVLGRPPVANATELLVVATLRDPVVQPGDVDRLLLQASAAGLAALVVLNKCDLASPAELAAYARPYRAAGYRVLETVAPRHVGVDRLRDGLEAGLSVLAGPSGVGKSSLLRALADVAAKVGTISPRLRRGRQTTRTATLHDLGGGRLLADTPGFSALELPDVPWRDLRLLYPEFSGLECRFADCVHRLEPDCAVQEAVREGRVDSGRYERYLRFLEEMEGRPPKWR